MNSEQIVVAIIGGSGSGKDTVVGELLKRHPDWEKVKSKTTRACRDNTTDKENHVFTDVSEFYADLQDNKIIASTQYDKNFYWATFSQLNSDSPVIFYIVDVAGLRALKERYRDKPLLSVGLIIDPKIAEKRMRERGDSEENISRRIQNGDYASYESCDWGLDASRSVEKIADDIEKLIRMHSYLNR